MKLVKSQLLLYLYDILIKGGEIFMEQTMNELHLSRRTFFRYISEIRAFFCNFYTNQELVYNNDTKSYRLK